MIKPNINFKAYTPKLIKNSGKDSNNSKPITNQLLTSKSYAKIFETTTFIEEDQDSYEDDVEGVDAKMLFYKKSKNLHKMIEKQKDSPFLKFL